MRRLIESLSDYLKVLGLENSDAQTAPAQVLAVNTSEEQTIGEISLETDFVEALDELDKT